jgi:hypothetical protein
MTVARRSQSPRFRLLNPMTECAPVPHMVRTSDMMRSQRWPTNTLASDRRQPLPGLLHPTDSQRPARAPAKQRHHTE